MPSNKIQRINEDIQRVLASLLRNIKDPRVAGPMLSVTHVETTADLRHAKVYVSAMGESREKELKLGLKSASGYLRRELGRVLDLRYTPELSFEIDHSIEHGMHISKLLNDLEITASHSSAEDGYEDINAYTANAEDAGIGGETDD